MSQISTHVLDTASGRPAEGITIQLFGCQGGSWSELAGGVTDSDGRITELLPEGEVLAAGVYRIYFDTAAYYEGQNANCFYPYVDIVFQISGAGEHYHIPLLLTPYGYSTYRGS